MPACSFCKKHYKEPRGLTLFTFDGKSIYFCSSKCRRNAKLKRDPKKVKWIKKSRVTLTGGSELQALKETKLDEVKEEKIS